MKELVGVVQGRGEVMLAGRGGPPRDLLLV